MTMTLPHLLYRTGQFGGSHSGAGKRWSNQRQLFSTTFLDWPMLDKPAEVSRQTKEWMVFVKGGGIMYLSMAGLEVKDIWANATVAISLKS